jgi:hypothetical protein
VEIVADGGEYGINGVAGSVSELIASHAVLGLEMTDHRLDRGTPPKLASDLWRGAALLTCGEDSELIIGGGVVAAIAGVGDGATECIADERLHGRDYARQRVAIVWVAGNAAT